MEREEEGLNSFRSGIGRGVARELSHLDRGRVPKVEAGAVGTWAGGVSGGRGRSGPRGGGAGPEFAERSEICP